MEVLWVIVGVENQDPTENLELTVLKGLIASTSILYGLSLKAFLFLVYLDGFLNQGIEIFHINLDFISFNCLLDWVLQVPVNLGNTNQLFYVFYVDVVTTCFHISIYYIITNNNLCLSNT